MKLTEKQFVEELTGGESAFVLGVYRNHDSDIMEDLNKLSKLHAEKLPRCTAKLVGKIIHFSNGWEMRLNVGRKKTYHKLENDTGMKFLMRKIPIVMDNGEELTRDYVVFYIPN